VIRTFTFSPGLLCLLRMVFSLAAMVFPKLEPRL
jgi:hypothetical protein